MNWNVKRILDDFGGPNDLHARLEREGYDLTLRAVRQWVRRDKVPPNWLAVLLTIKGQNPCGWLDAPVPDAREIEIEDIF